MARREFRSLDRVCISVTGEQAQRLLSAAASSGIRLSKIQSSDDGYTATLPGRDWRRLAGLAEKYGLRLSLLQTEGPGGLVAKLWQRPGLVLGAILFFLMVHILSGFVWTIDFGTLDGEQAETVRAFLNAQGIREGTRITQELLVQTGRALEAQPELFGWASLHFSGGCLFVESTPMQQQQIRQPEEQTALYASADAEIVLIEVESGFTQVVPGQLVAKGQLLAAAERFDRDGNSVLQSASGSVLGRVRAEYTAQQAYEQTATLLTGRTADSRVLYLLGMEFPLGEDTEGVFAHAAVQESWTPLALGRIALPGCICTRESREQSDEVLQYSQEAAQAMAKRACMQQLLAQYPDARIEQQSFDYTAEPNGVTCRASFVFCADIAEAGATQPLDPPQA